MYKGSFSLLPVLDCYIGGSGVGMAQGIHGLTLPEISADSGEEYERSWKRFEVIAAANKWEGGRDLAILPALLRGKLLDIYMQLPDADKADGATLKKALADRAGLTKDPLSSAKMFGERCQEPRESVRDFEMALCKLFMEAYPSDNVKTASVLLGRFVTGLRPELARQVLLCGTPDNLADAVKNAIRVERAMGFDDGQRVQAVQTGGSREDLRELMDKLAGRMEALELRLSEQKPVGVQRPRILRCYLCDRKGHTKRYCPFRENDGGNVEQVSEVCYCNSTSLRVQGMLGGQSVSFLVDSGAAVSVVSYDILPPSARASINRTAPLTIGANGIPLDVLGTVNVMVVLETIKVHQDFVVARKLTVECLLGMDFLSRHGAIIDCFKRQLTLAVHDKGKARHEGREGGTALVVNLAQTIKIPARSQLLVRGKMENLDNIKGEGLIEPVGDTQRGILVAHCFCKVDDSNEVPLQIVNTGLTDTILYEGTRVATFMEGSACSHGP